MGAGPSPGEAAVEGANGRREGGAGAPRILQDFFAALLFEVHSVFSKRMIFSYPLNPLLF